MLRTVSMPPQTRCGRWSIWGSYVRRLAWPRAHLLLPRMGPAPISWRFERKG